MTAVYDQAFDELQTWGLPDSERFAQIRMLLLDVDETLDVLITSIARRLHGETSEPVTMELIANVALTAKAIREARSELLARASLLELTLDDLHELTYRDELIDEPALSPYGRIARQS